MSTEKLSRSRRRDDDREIYSQAQILSALSFAFQLSKRESISAQNIDALCNMFAYVVDAKSPYTYHHSVRVAETAEGIARHLGMAPECVVRVRRAALLHDIGKLFIPEAVLHKADGLTPDELDAMREHASFTEEILRCVGAFNDLATMASRHHERLDGSGYPRGLKADDLTTEDRVIAVADFYSAITEDRPYHKAVSHDEAMAVLDRFVPHKLDAVCVQALGAVRGDGIHAA